MLESKHQLMTAGTVHVTNRTSPGSDNPGRTYGNKSQSMLASMVRETNRVMALPVTSSKRSASVDLPWSMCAMIEKLRMRECGTASRAVTPLPRGCHSIGHVDHTCCHMDRTGCHQLMLWTIRPDRDAPHSLPGDVGLGTWTVPAVTWTIPAVINWCFGCKITRRRKEMTRVKSANPTG
jgi:hypothetical protein